MRKWLALLLFPLTVQAAGEGAWQDSGMGVTLNYRGVSASVSYTHLRAHETRLPARMPSSA